MNGHGDPEQRAEENEAEIETKGLRPDQAEPMSEALSSGDSREEAA